MHSVFSLNPNITAKIKIIIANTIIIANNTSLIMEIELATSLLLFFSNSISSFCKFFKLSFSKFSLLISLIMSLFLLFFSSILSKIFLAHSLQQPLKDSSSLISLPQI